MKLSENELMNNTIRILGTGLVILTILATFLFLTEDASAVPSGYSTTTSSGDIAWVLVASVVVFAMVPGIAFFYGGMLRKQSLTSMIAQCLIATGIMTMTWIICGYTLAFGSNGFFIGNLDHLFMKGVVEDISDGSISELEFAMFQMFFAIVTACVVIGASAERIRFPAIAWFLVFWGVFVYTPMAHWVWGGGFFDQAFVVRDFAGGTAVHICAGVTGLALATFLGTRSASIRKMRAHSIPLTFLGAMILWIGWLGFNGGSGILIDGQAVRICFVTMVASAAGLLTWAVCQYSLTGRVGALGLITGAIAGLVAITPGCAYVSTAAAFVIGIGGALVCYCSIRYFHSKSDKVDDALDVFALHGVGGIWGAIATGIFAEACYTGSADATGNYIPGPAGLVFGGGVDLVLGQICSVLITLVFCFSVSYAIIWVISKFIKVRVTADEEVIGQDIVEHGEPAYSQ